MTPSLRGCVLPHAQQQMQTRFPCQPAGEGRARPGHSPSRLMVAVSPFVDTTAREPLLPPVRSSQTNMDYALGPVHGPGPPAECILCKTRAAASFQTGIGARRIQVAGKPLTTSDTVARSRGQLASQPHAIPWSRREAHTRNLMAALNNAHIQRTVSSSRDPSPHCICPSLDRIRFAILRWGAVLV